VYFSGSKSIAITVKEWINKSSERRGMSSFYVSQIDKITTTTTKESEEAAHVVVSTWRTALILMYQVFPFANTSCLIESAFQNVRCILLQSLRLVKSKAK
jgi:hypothetical protein